MHKLGDSRELRGFVERQKLSDEAYFELHGNGQAVDAETRADFDALVVPLERQVGRPLSGPNRTKCLHAHAENPDGFRRLVDEAGHRGRVNPLGLLVRMVLDGDYRMPEAAA